MLKPVFLILLTFGGIAEAGVVSIEIVDPPTMALNFTDFTSWPQGVSPFEFIAPDFSIASTSNTARLKLLNDLSGSLEIRTSALNMDRHAEVSLAAARDTQLLAQTRPGTEETPYLLSGLCFSVAATSDEPGQI